ncbi:MAG TPA: VanZ family protein [Terriglobia bacterium]|nr:VanZ family protein [Terriglobia bacterium]
MICVFVLCSILVLGLWPFHHPQNEVTWLGSENGLRFGDHGTVLSSGTFNMPSGQDAAFCSLEIWVEPDRPWNWNTVLAFYTPQNPAQFSLRQSNGDLELRSEIGNQNRQSRTTRLYVERVFPHRRQLFITVTSGAQQTEIYVDGVLVRTSRDFRLSSRDFTGRLVVGTSPVENDSWSGQLRGLAIYDEELTAAQVLRHYETWTKKGQPEVAENERAVGLYLFDERAGRVVHNQAGPGIDLHIPEDYQIVDEKFLEPPWREFKASRGYWKNALINIVGFIPLGFFFCAYLSSARRIKRAALATIVLGAAVSLTIEVLQAYLPTRDSGMTDIITNTLGTSLGAMLYGWGPARALFTRVLNGVSFGVLRWLEGTRSAR